MVEGARGQPMITLKDRLSILHGLDKLIAYSYETAKEKGWHEQPREFGTIIALIHSELSEALEEFRAGKDRMYIGEGGKPEGIAVEFADVIIRVADACGELGIDLPTALLAKMNYNKTRPYRHGGKTC